MKDYSDINTKTKQKVINAASRMGYVYSNSSKKKGNCKDESHLVGVLIHGNPNEQHHTIHLAGISDEGAKLNVTLVFHYFRTSNCEQVLDPAQQSPAMREGQLSGLILVNRWPSDIVRQLSTKMPCISIVYHALVANLDLVAIDDSNGISILMEHLYNLGHRKIGFLGRCGSLIWSRTRFAGYAESLCRLGLELDPRAICDVLADDLESKSSTIDGVVDNVAKQIRCGVRAWVCANDWAGYVLCRGLLDRGFRVPADVSITGFDNSENDRFGCPELTSMTMSHLKMGAEALRILMTRLRHPKGPQLSVKLQCKFVEGVTTAPPPGA